jgi:capsular polysaccharide biosynthesis protein
MAQAAACQGMGVFGRKTLGRAETMAFIREENPQSTSGAISLLERADRYEILKWGVLRADKGKCLDVDYGSRAAIAGWFGPVEWVEKAAALWSHPWMGYYHWIIDVAPKIALLQDRFGRDLDGWKLCYPREGSTYEKETLDLLEVPDSAVIDTKNLRAVRTRKVALTVLPGWYEIQPAAALLHERLIDKAGETAGERIYVSRKGRRKCLNETEVFAILAARGFTFVEDKPRSLADQIGIFSNAKVIVAPHGAALTNLLWCEQGTRVIELFGETYQPPYYRNLSRFRSLDYRKVGADCADEGHWSEVNADLSVDTKALESLLDQLHLS